MAAGDFVVGGTATLLKSAGGVIPSVTVTATGCAAGNYVIITPLSTIPEGRDGVGCYTYHVESVTTNSFKIVGDRNELEADISFSFVVFDNA